MKTCDVQSLLFCNPEALKGREEKFCKVEVWVAPVLASWSQSLFAHEWLTQDGKIKSHADMSEIIQEKRKVVEVQLDSGKPIMRPVLGIGVLDNIEIGSGRDIFLALAARGAEFLPVHIPLSNKNEFKIFIRSE